MKDTEYVAIVDTNRDELRERIAKARLRFDRLVRSADPLARVPGSDWTVQQTVAHVLTVGHRNCAGARGQDFRRAAYPTELALINQEELEAAMAPISELADQLQAVEAELDGYFDEASEHEVTVVSHAGAVLDAVGGQAVWLGEFLLHGYDIARAIKAPWELPERDMLLVVRGLLQYGPAYVNAPAGTDISVVFKIPEARPYLLHIHDGTTELRESRPDDRPDAVMRVRASTFAQMLYKRVGPFAAARQGLLIVGGRRPWRALKLQSYFETA